MIRDPITCSLLPFTEHRAPPRSANDNRLTEIVQHGKNMPADLEPLVRRMIWWKPPEEALRWPERLIAQVMTLGTWEDIQLARQHWGEEAFRRVLADPPAGVFDPRSWNYWHVVFGLEPTPPLPRRTLVPDA